MLGHIAALSIGISECVGLGEGLSLADGAAKPSKDIVEAVESVATHAKTYYIGMSEDTIRRFTIKATCVFAVAGIVSSLPERTRHNTRRTVEYPTCNSTACSNVFCSKQYPPRLFSTILVSSDCKSILIERFNTTSMFSNGIQRLCWAHIRLRVGKFGGGSGLDGS